MNEVAWHGAVASIRTLADGGANVTLQLPEDSLARVIATLAALRNRPVRIAIVADDDDN